MATVFILMLVVILLQHPINHYLRHDKKPDATLKLAALCFASVIMVVFSFVKVIGI